MVFLFKNWRRGRDSEIPWGNSTHTKYPFLAPGGGGLKKPPGQFYIHKEKSIFEKKYSKTQTEVLIQAETGAVIPLTDDQAVEEGDSAALSGDF